MAVTGGPMFLQAVDRSGETKDKYFIANLMKEVINEVGHENVIQIITTMLQIVRVQDKILNHSFLVHTLNLALKNTYAARSIDIAKTQFSSTIIMLKRFELSTGVLQTMVINDKWEYYREDDVVKAKCEKELVHDDIWDLFDSFEDVGMLEVASLSLDEPELEAIVFIDVGGEAQVQVSQEIIGDE
ncbi:DUF659 domain-containing protein/Dimer_Tnp_hAT domain-containing protein [Cucumis melo var. makuwa]|uniref:DUF659 domain-containing protein/Dimer_Tnp_hAT domain-containing protein n=1 Tax=Cucumis melo var. makuwa TaxID=1194695 RepID=A0A5D3CLB1_CUCMM|nr:DUF659 domain-containing protein/Dimer_Tnp_hAT domain-containing protein [Cucumis melo var. makuwa]